MGKKISPEQWHNFVCRCAWLILPLGVFVFILVDVSLRSSAQLRSLGGIAAFILFSLVCSKNPSKVGTHDHACEPGGIRQFVTRIKQCLFVDSTSDSLGCRGVWIGSSSCLGAAGSQMVASG